MGFLEWATSPWGQSVPIHIAWFLIWVALIAGLLFLIVHAIYVMYFAKAREFAGDASPQIVAQIPKRVPRHSLVARLFHWIMAASMFTLLFTAFLPKVGVQFNWVTYHWIAGTVLTVSIVFHIIHASFWLDFWSIWPDRIDLDDAWKRVRRFLGMPAPPPRKFAKYPLENKLFHGVIILCGLSVILTGVFMMFRVRTIFFPSESVSIQRHDLGPDVCAPRIGGRWIDCARHDARLYGSPPGETRDHEVDDLRLDGPRLLSGRARSRAMEGRDRFFVTNLQPDRGPRANRCWLRSAIAVTQ